MAKTRSAVSAWLIGMPNENILGSGLPTNGSILRNFLFHHQERGMRIADSAKATIQAKLVIWATTYMRSCCRLSSQPQWTQSWCLQALPEEVAVYQQI